MSDVTIQPSAAREPRVHVTDAQPVELHTSKSPKTEKINCIHFSFDRPRLREPFRSRTRRGNVPKRPPPPLEIANATTEPSSGGDASNAQPRPNADAKFASKNTCYWLCMN